MVFGLRHARIDDVYQLCTVISYRPNIVHDRSLQTQRAAPSNKHYIWWTAAFNPPPSTSTSSHCSPRCHVPYSFRRAIHVKNYLNSLLSQQAVGIDVIINFKIGFRPTQRTQHRNRHLLANRTWGVRTMRATIARKEINRASIARALMNSRNDRK